MYIDDLTYYALVSCEGNNNLVVIDLDSKGVVASYVVGSGPDVLAFDQGLHRLYVAAESGDVTSFTVRETSSKNWGKRIWQTMHTRSALINKPIESTFRLKIVTASQFYGLWNRANNC